jgi:hypothetical protein
MKSKEIIAQYGIPKRTIATLAAVHPPEVSLFLRDKSLVSAAKASRIDTVIENIVYASDKIVELQIAERLPPLRPDLRDTENLAFLIDHFKKTDALNEECEAIQENTRAVVHDLVAAVQRH